MAVAKQNLRNFKGANLNIEMFGGNGDGVFDNWNAIRSAVAALKKVGGRLTFPRGRYRVRYDATDASRTATTGVIDLSPWSSSGVWTPTANVEVHFASGAVLLMDNLMPNGYDAQYHAIFARCRWTNIGGTHTPTVWTGYAVNYHDITLTNVRVEWATKGSARGVGDSFRFAGTKSETTAPYGITLENCSAKNAPQVGCIFMGCKEVHVQNFKASDDWADTCHFNACFDGCTADTVKAKRCGDDVFAAVTYYPDAITLASGVDIDTEVGPFTSPDQVTANNNGLEAINIQKIGGGANCVRLQGANRVSVSNVYADAAGDAIGAAVWVGSVLANGTTLGQTSMACVGCQVSHVVGKGCQVGEMVVALGFTGSESDAWLRNEVTLRDIRSTESTQYSFLAQATRGFRIDGAEMDTMKAFFIDSSTFRIDNWNQSGSNVEIYGVNSNYYDTHDIDTAPWHNIKIGHVNVEGGLFLIRNARGISIDGEVFVQNAPEAAIQFERVTDVRASALRSINANRNNSASIRAIRFLAARRFSVTRAEVTHDATQLEGAWEFGGGDAYNVTHDVRVSLIHRTGIADTASRIIIQGSTYAPTDLYYTARYRNAADTWTRINQDDLPLPTTGLTDLVAYGTNLGAVVSPANPVGSWLLERSAGAAGGYLVGAGGNVRFDGSNWIISTDGGSNGAAMLVVNYGDGNLQFYAIPSTGGTSQSFSTAAMLAFRVGVLDTAGKFTVANLKATAQASAKPARFGSSGDLAGGPIALDTGDATSSMTVGALVQVDTGGKLKAAAAFTADRILGTNASTGAVEVHKVDLGNGAHVTVPGSSTDLLVNSGGVSVAGLPYSTLESTLKTYFDTIYAAIVHTHAESDITNLTTDLGNKSNTGHTHTDSGHTHGGVTAGSDTSGSGSANIT